MLSNFRAFGIQAMYSAGLAFALLMLAVTTAHAQFTVTPSNTQGWSPSSADGGTVSLDASPGSISGAGALHIVIGPTVDSRAQYTRNVSMPLSAVTDVSFYAKQISGPSYAGPSYALSILLDGTPGSFTNMVFEPYYNGTITPGAWQLWDVDAGTLWSSHSVNAGGSCVITGTSGGPPSYNIAQLKADCPNAVVTRQVIYAGTYNQNFNVLADLVRLNNVVYDFEPAPANIVKVTAADLGTSNWFIFNDETNTVDNSLVSFVTGPSSPTYGSGSAQISVTGTQRRNMSTSLFGGTNLADITVMKFSTYNPSAGNGGSANRSGYLNFNVDFNSSNTYQNRLSYVPSSNGSVSQNTWKEWDAINGGSALWNFSGATWPAGVGGGGEPGTTLKTWSQILSQYPSAKMLSLYPFTGVRVGEPYADGYTENLDSFTFGTAAGTTVYDFEPLPTVVDDDGAASATDCNASDVAYSQIQAAINAANAGATIKVCPGNYVEDVNLNKGNMKLLGSGIDVSTITGPWNSGTANTVLINASGVLVDGFTITRNGNSPAQWGTNLKSQGVSFSAPGSGSTLQNSKLTGNRNAIYVGQSSNNNIIRRNIIDFNRTGIHIVDNNGTLVEENQVTNNWTMGLLYRSEGGPGPFLMTVRNNHFSGNWYSEIEFREPADGGNLNMSGNYLGATVTRVNTPSGEPGYTSQIPVAYGGSSVAPASHPTIAGPQSGRIDYSPFLNFGTDTQPGTTGFQGDFTHLTATADSPQANGAVSSIQEAVNMANAGGSVTALNGTYAGSVDVNKAITLKGTPTISGSLTASVAGAVISPGFSPGIINSGNLSLTSGSTVNIELNGTTVGTQYDQLNVTGTVSLGGASLNVIPGFTPAVGNQFVIVNNDGADAVAGTFNAMPEGTVFYIGAIPIRISYAGGDGNDVVLSAVNACNTVSIPVGITTPTAVQVTVPINVNDTTGNGLISYDFTLTFDNSVINNPVVSTAGTLSSGMTITTNQTANSITVSGFQSDPLAGAGTLLNINFQAVGAPGTSSAVNFASFVFNEGACSNATNGSVNIIGGTVSGVVSYANTIPSSFRPVPNTTLNAAGSVNFSTNSAFITGAYTLSGFGAGPYTVTPSKTGDVNGITSFDAGLIAQQVVGQANPGLVPFNANQIAAADVSGNGTITSFDAGLIARWIALLPASGNTGTWKFNPVNRSYASGVTTNMTGEDYAATLMGEVSGNWAAPTSFAPFFEPIAKVPSKDAVSVSIGQIVANEGETVDVPVMVQDTTGKGIISYQFDVAYNPEVVEPATEATSVVGTLSGNLAITTNVIEEGKLRVVVYGAYALAGEGTLMNLRFTATGPAGSATKLLFEGFQFNEDRVESVTVDGQMMIARLDETGTISGRLLTAAGNPVANGRVTLTGMNGESRTVRSNSFGLFTVSGLRQGGTYTVTAAAKGTTFATRTVSVTADAVALDLIANE